MILNVETSRPEKAPMALMVEWLSGDAPDHGLTFNLVSGAGFGSPNLVLTVQMGDKRIIEVIDIRNVVDDWVRAIQDEMQASA